jgi:hypothetical protein
MEGPGPSLIASDTVSSLFRNGDRDRGGPCGPTFQILVVPSPTYVMVIRRLEITRWRRDLVCLLSLTRHRAVVAFLTSR